MNEELCESTVRNRLDSRLQWQTLEKILVDSAGPNIDRANAFRELVAGVLRPIPPLECIDDKPVPIE